MYYCPKCNMAAEENRCPVCGSRRLREPQPDDLCFLIRKEHLLSDLLKDTLKQNEIPFIARSDLGAGMAMILGAYLENDNFFVPYRFLEQAKELLNDLEASVSTEETPEEDLNEEAEEESDG